MVDISEVHGIINQQTSLGGHHLVAIHRDLTPGATATDCAPGAPGAHVAHGAASAVDGPQRSCQMVGKQTWLAGKWTIKINDFSMKSPFIWEFPLLSDGWRTLSSSKRLHIEKGMWIPLVPPSSLASSCWIADITEAKPDGLSGSPEDEHY